MEGIFTVENMVALLTLAALEIVLGIDNVIFISILAGKLPHAQQASARRMGIGAAVGTRILLLLMINWVIGLTAPLFSIFGNGLSGRDLILLVGGLFLIAKSTFEIHEKLESAEHEHATVKKGATFAFVILQIAILDIVFSLDSVITAVGISGKLFVMIPAIVVAAVVMMVFSNGVAHFVDKHPTMKILALAFLILIGSILVIEGWDPEVVHQLHLKNYVYFAMAFSFLVEMVNIKVRKAAPVHLHNRPKTPPPA